MKKSNELRNEMFILPMKSHGDVRFEIQGK